MNEAAGHLTGPHDFLSFGRAHDPEASAERILYELRCKRDGDIIRIRARANAFIQQMVRSLVGTLIQVGEGKRSPDEMTTVLEVKDRTAAGPVAAPHGLCLVSVEYDSGWSGPPGPRAL
jgi:tRNA pseudouridine38-40 synthase